jgi:copper chaperone CopZ
MHKPVIISFLLFFALQSWQVTFAIEEKTKTITVKTAIYCDHCIKCSSCSPNIKKQVSALDGVKQVKVIPDSNHIKVTYLPELCTPEKIRQAINEAGYDADNLKAPAEAVNKLDACCQKHD